MKKLGKKLSAFGLIETLVACAILMIICGALLTINLIITRDIAFIKGRSVAYNLAQEAIESARQIRDSNLIDSNQNTNWDTFICKQAAPAPHLSRPINDGAHYYKISTLAAAQTSNCYGLTPRVTMISDVSASGEQITIGSKTYTRKISFLVSGLSPRVVNLASQDVTEENAIRVVVEINWVDSGSSHNIKTTELLTNWKRGF